jgi:hypothetical protein
MRLKFRFQTVAQKRFRKLGVGLTAECSQELDKTLSIGISRLEHQRALEKEEVLRRSEETLLRILKDVCARAQALGNSTLIDRKAFEDTRKRMSPMWPFF